MTIHLGRGLDLPLEAVTETFALLGKRGSGKTSTAVVLVEELIGARQVVVVVDPVGVWYGLRHDADGKGPGLPVIILGGEHGDLPLEETAGAVIADTVVDARQSLVLDLSGFSKGAARRFMTDFAERLYHAKSTHREPLHLVLDEADAWAPQRTEHGGERLLGAINDLVRRGRARGIGCTLITQRPAVLNKDVLSQAEVLVALRLTGPHDRKAIETWVEHQADPTQAKELLGSLAELPVGTAWVWSPGWLEIFKKVAIRPRRTFDSSATPKAGARVIAPKEGAAVDLDVLRKRMAATIERSRADDPKLLRARIADLEKTAKAAAPQIIEKRVEVPALSPADRQAIEEYVGRLESTANALRAVAALLRDALAARPHPTTNGASKPRREPLIVHTPTVMSLVQKQLREERTGKLPRAEQKILTALAQYPDGRTKVQIAILTGYAHNGGGFSNAVSALRTRGWIEGGGDLLRITDAGSAALGPFVPLPTGAELLRHWMGQLGRAERSALEALAKAYPHALSKEDVAREAGYEASGGGFNNALSKLRTLELITGRGELRMSGALA
jgi:hypothetical protein